MFTLLCVFFAGLLTSSVLIDDGDEIVIQPTDDLTQFMCSNPPGRRIVLLDSEEERCVFKVEEISGGCPANDGSGLNVVCYLMKVENGLNEGVTRQCLSPITPTLGLPRLGLKDCDLNDPKQKWSVAPPVIGVNSFINPHEDSKYITKTPDGSFDVNLEEYASPGTHQFWRVTLQV